MHIKWLNLNFLTLMNTKRVKPALLKSALTTLSIFYMRTIEYIFYMGTMKYLTTQTQHTIRTGVRSAGVQ